MFHAGQGFWRNSPSMRDAEPFKLGRQYAPAVLGTRLRAPSKGGLRLWSGI